MHEVPELGSAASLDALYEEIESLVNHQYEPIAVDVARRRGRELTPPLREAMKEVAIPVKAWARREIEILKREAALGIRRAERAGGVSINISGGTVTGLNLGTVIGDFQAVYVSLQDAGNADLANRLKDLIEAVGQENKLGEQRVEVIQSLVTIGEQAALPEAKRRRGVVRGLLPSIEKTLSVAANLTQLWVTLQPVIMSHFRLV